MFGHSVKLIKNKLLERMSEIHVMKAGRLCELRNLLNSSRVDQFKLRIMKFLSARFEIFILD